MVNKLPAIRHEVLSYYCLTVDDNKCMVNTYPNARQIPAALLPLPPSPPKKLCWSSYYIDYAHHQINVCI